MGAVTCTATVREDGALAIPGSARRRLRLRKGDEVEVTLAKPLARAPQASQNPLLGLVGIGKGGPADGAENHDKYLYRKRSA